MKSFSWCRVMQLDEPTWRVFKIDVWEESGVGVGPKVTEPIWRRAKVNGLHRFNL